MLTFETFNKISDYLWEVPQSFQSDMNVPARIYATEKMLKDILDERSVEQLLNVSTLPGIEKYAIAMPDIHQGYGFPIGGVAAIRAKDGVISPGGVGYDINCGVRLLASGYTAEELKDQIEPVANQMQRDIPSGVGRGGRLKLSDDDIQDVLNRGVPWAIENGYGRDEDLDTIESNGTFKGADAAYVSEHAKKRGIDQLGTIGAGNHFVEMQEVVEIYDKEAAEAFGLFQGQITVMVHTGSRGLGHQNCTDHVKVMNTAMDKYDIHIPDRELACVPLKSDEGQAYFKSMAACANYAWTNRQVITHNIRGAWEQVLGQQDKAKLDIIYDVGHNNAKLEKHGKTEYIIHRKGATRAFGPGHPELPKKYQAVGQPVLIPGSMGTYSYVLAGTKEAMTETFGSSCHGAGRSMSRTQAKKTLDYNKLRQGLHDYGVVVRAGSPRGLLEEAPEAYKDIDEVIEVVHNAKIAKKVVKLKPVAIIKG